MKFIPYIILGVPLVIFLLQFRKGKVGGWQHASISVLSIIILLYFLLHSGIIGEFIVKLGDKEFYISSHAFEKLITKNIDQFAQAMSIATEKTYKFERIEIWKKPSNVFFTKNDNDELEIKFKLMTKPIWSTVRLTPSYGRIPFNPYDPDGFDKENNIIITQMINMDFAQAKEYIEKNKVYVDVRYFEKVD